jgi:RNA polymerase sigma-70 factor (ECF subfamily)
MHHKENLARLKKMNELAPEVMKAFWTFDKAAVAEGAIPVTLGADEERTRLVEVLRKAVAEKLSTKQRTAIVCMLQDMPTDQIVELLGTNRNSAYKLLHDARRALKH